MKRYLLPASMSLELEMVYLILVFKSPVIDLFVLVIKFGLSSREYVLLNEEAAS